MKADKGRYAGVLATDDPLYERLSRHLAAARGDRGHRDYIFDVQHLDAAGVVYLYRERHTGVRIVAKFYGNKPVGSPGDGCRDLHQTFLRREFGSIRKLRSLGFAAPPIRVVRPLGIVPEVNYVLLLEHVAGDDLQDGLRSAASKRQFDGNLERKLRLIARFLAQLHSRARCSQGLDLQHAPSFLQKMIATHVGWGFVSAAQQRIADDACARWSSILSSSSDHQVLIHGDATPPHFLFKPNGAEVTVIDLERVWPGDAAKDLGCLAAEVKCAFWQATDNPTASEPYELAIRDEYSRESGDLCTTLAARAAFYEGCYQLRIARNAWIPPERKMQFIKDALARVQSAVGSG